MPVRPLDLIATDTLLDDEERAIRDTVRQFGDDRLRPHIADWFEAGTLPARELARELGGLGVLGMHLEGYGCAGTSAVAYGLACMELEAVDSGIRSLVSVQGSLAMFAIWKWGARSRSSSGSRTWPPARRSAASASPSPTSARTRPACAPPPSGTAPTGCSTAPRCGSPTVPIADVAVVWAQTDEGIRGFVVPTDTPGFSAPVIKSKLCLRASITSELVLEDVRLPASAVFPDVTGLKGPLSCLSEARFGIVFGVVGAARDCLETAIDYAINREQFDRPIAGFQLTQKKLADMTVELDKAFLLALHLGRLKDAGAIRPEMVSVGKLNNVREAMAIARESRTILGANGVTLEYPVLRHANNLESVLTYEGTEEIHTLVVGQAVTGIAAYR